MRSAESGERVRSGVYEVFVSNRNQGRECGDAGRRMKGRSELAGGSRVRLQKKQRESLSARERHVAPKSAMHYPREEICHTPC